MWAKIITIKRSKDLNHFSLCALNLFNTRVSQFELNYWNYWDAPVVSGSLEQHIGGSGVRYQFVPLSRNHVWAPSWALSIVITFPSNCWGCLERWSVKVKKNSPRACLRITVLCSNPLRSLLLFLNTRAYQFKLPLRNVSNQSEVNPKPA